MSGLARHEITWIDADGPRCTARTGPVWVRGSLPGGNGEPCGCVLPAGHLWTHRCDCGTNWQSMDKETRANG